MGCPVNSLHRGGADLTISATNSGRIACLEFPASINTASYGTATSSMNFERREQYCRLLDSERDNLLKIIPFA
jgi:hypothetical protein